MTNDLRNINQFDYLCPNSYNVRMTMDHCSGTL